ncbi:MAG: hypothetical protein E6J20_18620 [Chloroflexi bacterium]|nr:MAG: hypothetical protein E6J20_18620 [Chloroflexota bacterium]
MWPTDGLPRFKVAVMEGGYGDDDNPVCSPVSYVYDRARNHRIEAVYHGSRARQLAEKAAARFEHLVTGEPPKPIPPGSKLRHGTYSCYVNLRCRCYDCAEYTRRQGRAHMAAARERKAAQATRETGA